MSRLLIVEDNVEIANPIRDYLVRRKYEISLAMDARRAYDKLSSSQYDLIIIDASEDVEVRSGRTLTEILIEEYPSVRRVALTGHGWWMDKEITLKSKYHLILTKPIMLKDLYENIQQQLERI